MKTEWDYSKLAKAYLKRPNYSPQAIEKICTYIGLSKESKVCDVGAGVGHLTLEWASRGIEVMAIEPNDQMRFYGMERTKNLPNVRWTEAIAEETKQLDNSYNAVTFGSSFNVCDRMRALEESKRIAKPNGWFVCLWNHRNLKDPLQKEIEDLICQYLPQYAYGLRREDQLDFLLSTGIFEEVLPISEITTHSQNPSECLEAWKSHGTLARQAKDKFTEIIDGIESIIKGKKEILIPYTTKVWIAKFKDK